MNIIEKKVKDLKPYEKNPRLNDDAVKYVAESIKEFGFKVPIVIDKDNNIVCGHTRWKACKKLKIDTVPCVVADDLTEEQIRAYRLAYNKVGEKAEWDLALLDTELAEIETIDMTLLGFDENVGAEPPQNLDDDTEKESIVITLNIKSQVDYEMIKQKVTEIIDGLDVSMAVKMA
jgi:ParB-like chromosome segregation protein Spo0J